VSVTTEVPDSFVETAIQQMFDLWITPQIETGVAQVEAGQVRQALIVMPPGGEPEVLLNERATLIAAVKARRDIAEGEPVTAADLEEISDLRPFGIDPAAGWMAFISIPGHGRIVSFDFRRDKPRAHEHLMLSRDYLATAREAVAAGRPGPAVELGFTAAELAVKAVHLLQAFPVKKRTAHQARLAWLNWYTIRDGNGSPDWFPAMQRLESLRSAARYSESSAGPLPDAAELGGLLDQVAELVDYAADRASIAPQGNREPAADSK
jgi:hypothetical protein